MIRPDTEIRSLQIVIDDDPQRRRRVRHADKRLAHDFARVDGLMRGEPVVARQDDDERLLGDQPVRQIGRLRLRPQEGHVELAPHERVGKFAANTGLRP